MAWTVGLPDRHVNGSSSHPFDASLLKLEPPLGAALFLRRMDDVGFFLSSPSILLLRGSLPLAVRIG